MRQLERCAAGCPACGEMRCPGLKDFSVAQAFMPGNAKGISLAFIYLTHLSNPKGCKESSRWSESAETTGSGEINFVAPRRGARSFAGKIFYVDLTSGTPSGCGHN